MSKVNVILDNEKYDFDMGITLKEVADKYCTEGLPAVCAKVDNELCSLDKKVTKDCSVQFLDYLSPVGNRIYQKGLMFLAVYAFKELYGYNNTIKMCHPIDKAILVRTSCPFKESNLEKLKAKMFEIVDKDMRFEKTLVTRKDAKEYFESIKFKSKADVLMYNTTKHVELYKLGDLYDYFYSDVMPYSTGILNKFELQHIDNHSFIFKFVRNFLFVF